MRARGLEDGEDGRNHGWDEENEREAGAGRNGSNDHDKDGPLQHLPSTSILPGVDDSRGRLLLDARLLFATWPLFSLSLSLVHSYGSFSLLLPLLLLILLLLLLLLLLPPLVLVFSIVPARCRESRNYCQYSRADVT